MTLEALAVSALISLLLNGANSQNQYLGNCTWITDYGRFSTNYVWDLSPLNGKVLSGSTGFNDEYLWYYTPCGNQLDYLNGKVMMDVLEGGTNKPLVDLGQ